MYRLVPSQSASEPQPNLLGAMAGLAIGVALIVSGFIGVLVISYYLPVTSTKSYWFISRSSGVVAYALITFGVLWGLIQSGSLFRSRVPPVLALGVHSYVNWVGLALAGLHG